MLTLPEFELIRPRTLEEAAAALGDDKGETMLLAGGTDLLPNLKHGLYAPRRLVSLRRVSELQQVRETDDGGLAIGAGVKLTELARHELVRRRYPALAAAAGLVGGPQLRNMATLGGNLCLDTRCLYYNQTRFWRGALGYCLKLEGDTCRVVKKGRKCVAAFSADTPGPLIAYGAGIRLVSASGERLVAAADFFVADGAANTSRAPGEIVAAVSLPPPAPGLRSAYQKLRIRQAIDYPLLSVALALRLEAKQTVADLRLVIGALGPRPRLVSGLGEISHGRRLGDELIADVAARAQRECRPLANLNVDPGWRREMIPVYVRRAFAGLQPSDPAEAAQP